MSIRFQADNDLRKSILYATLAKEPLVDFRSAQTAKLDGVPDLEVLADAAAQGRILVTHDIGTMPAHFQKFTRTSWSPGVLIVPQDLTIRMAVDCLLLVWGASQPPEWENRLCVLPSLGTILLGRPD